MYDDKLCKERLRETKPERVYHLLWRSLAFKYLITTQYKVAESRRELFAVFANDSIGNFISIDGNFEREQLDLVNDFVESLPWDAKDKTCCDIGANIGVHARYFAEIFSQVHAFEAHPRVYKLLEFNTETINNITHYQIGLGSKISSMKLSSNQHNLGGSSFRYDQGSGVYYDVNVDMLDNFITEIGDVGLLKIDVEGMELDVIKGASKIIKNCRPLILFEHSKEDFFPKSDLLETLKNLDYKFAYYQNDWHHIARYTRILRLIVGLLRGGVRKNHQLVMYKDIPHRHHDMIIAIPSEISA